jgi:hypothetical protein
MPDESETNVVTITVSVYPHQREQLDRVALQKGRSRSLVLRDVLDDWAAQKDSVSPTVTGIVAAWLAGVITADEAMQALAGQRDVVRALVP